MPRRSQDLNQLNTEEHKWKRRWVAFSRNLSICCILLWGCKEYNVKHYLISSTVDGTSSSEWANYSPQSYRTSTIFTIGRNTWYSEFQMHSNQTSSSTWGRCFAVSLTRAPGLSSACFSTNDSRPMKLGQDTSTLSNQRQRKHILA